MATREDSFKWTFSGSTGTGKAKNVKGVSQALTFGLETSSGCTGTFELYHRMGSSAGPYTLMHSTALSTGTFATVQLLGPLQWIKPRLVSLTSGSTNVASAYLLGN